MTGWKKRKIAEAQSVAINDTSPERVDEIQKQRHEQEPVAVIGGDFQLLYCRNDWSKGLKVGDYLYTTPPQRKPLPAHEIVTMYDESPTSDSEMIAFARAIEAAHGIKE